MGEYAKYGNREIKIGTCENMYYLRYEDRFKVRQVDGSINPGRELNLYWRLPFSDEDNQTPGSYDKYNRGEPLIGFEIENAKDHPGIIQISHECGLLVNIPCLHGQALPDMGVVKVFWNGKTSWFWELKAIKNEKDSIKAVVSCRFCNKSWTADISEIIEYVKDNVLKARLMNYIKADGLYTEVV